MILVPNTSGEPVKISGAAVVIDGPSTVKPPYVSSVELETRAKSETLTDQCGYTEVRKNGDSNWTLTVEGIISTLELAPLKQISRTTELLSVTSELYTGIAICDNSVITETDEKTGIEFPGKGYDGSESVFSFQLQLKEPQSPNGGGVIPNFS